MSTIEIKNLSFGYDNQLTPLFENVSLNLSPTWKLGLLGRNGRGKTTLLKLLMGTLPYQGAITTQLDFTYFPQKIADKTQLTSFIAHDLADFEDWQLEKELTQLKVDLDCLWRPFVTLSGGEQTKVMLALLFLNDNNFALIDEPTNHLDLASRKHVAAYLQDKKTGFIVVSHDRDFIDSVVDHVLFIEKQNIALFVGNFSTYEAEKANTDAFEEAQNTKLKAEISRLKKTARDKEDWSKNREGDIHGDPRVKGSGGTGHDGTITARAARVMKRSKAIEKRADSKIADKEKLLKNIEYVDPLTMNFVPTYHATALTVEDLVLSYDGAPLFQPVSFILKRSERLAIEAPNGYGKSALIQALTGHFTGELSGKIILPQAISYSLVRQIYDDNTGTLAELAESRQVNYQELLRNLQKLALERCVFTTPIENMSQGQQKKVELAMSLATPSALYFWDEALNYLDVFNHDQIETLLTTVQPTMLFVDHDQHFIEKVATKIIHLKR